MTNEVALNGALTAVESFVGGVGQLVAEGVGRCQDRVRQQETLCLQDKESVLQLLVRTGAPRRGPKVDVSGSILHNDCVCLQEEHRQDMEEVLVGRTLMGLSAVKELSDSLRATVETQRALADKVSPDLCSVFSVLSSSYSLTSSSCSSSLRWRR